VEPGLAEEQRGEGGAGGESGDLPSGMLRSSYEEEEDYIASPVSTIPEGSQEGETESERDDLSPYPRDAVGSSPRSNPHIQTLQQHEHQHQHQQQAQGDDAGETVIFQPGLLGLRVASNTEWGEAGAGGSADGPHPIRSIFAAVVEGFQTLPDGAYGSCTLHSALCTLHSALSALSLPLVCTALYCAPRGIASVCLSITV
jgi:hypothetical protein